MTTSSILTPLKEDLSIKTNCWLPGKPSSFEFIFRGLFIFEGLFSIFSFEEIIVSSNVSQEWSNFFGVKVSLFGFLSNVSEC